MSEQSIGQPDRQESPANSYLEHQTTGSYHEYQMAESYHESQTTDSYREQQARVFQGADPETQGEPTRTSEPDEEMGDREHTSLRRTTDTSCTDSPEYLEWKANGRPNCPRCLKSHFGECLGLTKWEADLLNRNPEGYALHRKRMKKPKSRRNRRVDNPRSQPSRQVPQHDQPSESRSTPYISPMADHPFVIEQGAAIISDCSPSQLEEVRRLCETLPHMAVVAQMAADAQQRLRVTPAYSAASRLSGTSQDDEPIQPQDATVSTGTPPRQQSLRQPSHRSRVRRATTIQQLTRSG